MSVPTAQYTPRTLMAALKQNRMPQMFLFNLFNKKEITLPTAQVEIDVVKNGQTKSAYVSPVGDPDVIKKLGKRTDIHAIPYLYETVPYSGKDTDERLAGASIYDDTTPQSMLDELVGEWLQTSRDRMARTKEFQLAEALTTGVATITGKDINYTVDFQMEPSHIIQNLTTDIWGSGTENKLKQLQDASALTRKAGAPAVTDVILGVDAADEFLSDAAILALLDNRRVEMGQINIKQVAEQGATYLGHISSVGLNVDVYSYQEQYQDEAGDFQNYIDKDMCLLGSTAARVETYYGKIYNLNHGSMVAKEFADNIIAPNGRKGEITLESAPLVAPIQIDSFVAITTK